MTGHPCCIRIEARHFVAGAITDGGSPRLVIRAAPTLAWAIGKPARDLCRWANGKHHRWSFREIASPNRVEPPPPGG